MYCKLEESMKTLRSQHDAILAENGKLEAKLRAQEINNQTESDSLANQVSQVKNLQRKEVL